MGSVNAEDDEQLFEVVISGIGGAFPESDNIDEFKQHLFDKVNLVTENGCRWNPDQWQNIPNATGKITGLDHLDATFFGMLRVVANNYDPAMRVALEKCFEAIADAGVNPFDLSGGDTQVYGGSDLGEDEFCSILMQTDNEYRWLLGHVRNFLSNRLSYVLNLHGSSRSYHCDWTGGLELLKLATDDVRKGRAKDAVVLVSNVNLAPEIMRSFNMFNCLSKNGETKSFDDEASGFGRSEGVIALFLQREGEARKEYAKIVHIDNHPGHTVPKKLLSFEPEPFQEFLSKFYSDCGVSPADVSFLETYGCGMPKVDEVELNVEADFFCKNRDTPLKIGSVKSNAGHSETSAAFVALAKALISLDSGSIPPNINYSTPNSKVPGLVDGRLQVVVEKTALDGNYVAVNCLNMIGGMSHVLLERRKRNEPRAKPYCDLPRLIVFSARHEIGISEVMSKIESGPMSSDYHDLIQKVFTKEIPNYFYRGYTILPITNPSPCHGSLEQISEKRSVWFVCTGMGCQWVGMACDLLKFPVFAQSLQECASILKSFDLDLMKIITVCDTTIFDNILNSFVGITAIQIALVDLLFSLGIKPDGIVGHSVGEVCCAYVDGGFTKKQALICSYIRGKASIDIPAPKGLMVAVGANYRDLTDLPSNVFVGCRNSSTSCTLSGLAEEVQNYCIKLKERNIFHKVVSTGNRAYHSKFISEVGEEFKREFEPYVPHPKKRSSKWISSSVPKDKWSTKLAQYASVNYQYHNFVNPVLFDAAIACIPENAVAIEIAPHGLLQSILTKGLPSSCVNIPLMKRNAGNQVNFLLSAIGKIYAAGVDVNLDPVYPPPKFPISTSVPCLAPLITWDHTDKWGHSKITQKIEATKMNFKLSSSKLKCLLSHQVENNIIIPISFVLLKLMEECVKDFDSNFDRTAFLFNDVCIKENLIMDVTDNIKIHVHLNSTNGNFELTLPDCRVVLEGAVSFQSASESDHSENDWHARNLHRFSALSIHHGTNTCLEKSIIYTMLENAGIHVTSPLIERIIYNNKECLVYVQWTNDKLGFLDSILKIQVVLDLLHSFEFNPLVPSSFQHLMLNFCDFKNVHEGSVIPVLVDLKTRRIETQGLTLLGLETAPIKFANKPKILAETLTFLPHINPPVQIFEQFMDLCLQLICEVVCSDWIHTGTAIRVLKRKNCNGVNDRILQAIELISSYHSNIYVDFQIVDDIKSVSTIMNENCVVLDDGLIFSSVFKEFHSGFLFVTLPAETPLLIDSNTALLTETVFDGRRFVLLRKVTGLNPMKILKMDKNSFDCKSVEKFSAISEELILVWEKVSNVDPIKILQEARKWLTVKHNTRFVFILDSNMRSFSLDDLFFAQQLKCGLVINILEKGQWGSLNNLALPTHNSQPQNYLSVSLKSALERFPIKLNCISVNLKDLTIDRDSKRENDFRYIDYVGLDSDNNQRVLGLAYFNENDSSIEYDPILKWDAPENWSDADLSTIPYHYCLAYYMLVELPHLDHIKSRRVLIMGGDSAIGQAAISVAIELGAIVLTVVENQNQASFLLKLFPQLKESQVFLVDYCLEFNIKKFIGSSLISLVINPYCGRLLQTSLNLLTKHGMCIQLGNVEMKRKKKIGLNIFLSDNSLLGLPTLDLSNLPSKLKIKIHDFVAEKLRTYSLKPLPRAVFSWNQAAAALEYLTKENQGGKAVLKLWNSVTDSLEGLNPAWQIGKTYLIVASKDSSWLQLVAWLLKRSVRKIVIATTGTTDNKTQQNHFYNLMEKCSKVSFLFLNDSDVESFQGTTKMFEAACSLGPPDVIFSLSLNQEELINIDAVSRNTSSAVSYFISLFSGAEELCCERTANGFPSINVESKSSGKYLKFVLPYLDSILDYVSTRNSVVSSSSVLINKFERHLKESDYIESLLPTSVHDLVDLSYELTNSAKFEEVTTRARSFKNFSESEPVFFIPGFCRKSFKSIFKSLMYPAFCATPVLHLESAEAMAFDLFQSLKSIKPNGPYSIVAETLSTCIALELGLLLENDGDTVKLFLIDGSPESIKQLLVECKSKIQNLNRKENLSTQLLKFEEVNVNVLATQLISKTEYAVYNEDKDRIKVSLESVQSKLKVAESYKMKPHLFKGEVLIVKQQKSPSELCLELLQTVNDNQEVFFTAETSYENLIQGPELLTLIHKHSLFQMR